MEVSSVAEFRTNDSADTSSTDGIAENYDFIVIGGGTAGLVVASRLTEDPNIRVLVLEAGENRLADPRILTPGLSGSLYDNPKYDWCFRIVPQKELNGRILPWQRGKVLGGSSAINQMKTLYTSKSAFDSWEKMGNPGWNWNVMLPYLRRFHTHHAHDENFQDVIDIAIESEAVKSNEGPIQTSYSTTSDVDKAWYSTWKQIMTDLKYEGKDLGGVLAAAAIDPESRTRSYAATGYYAPEMTSRPNVRVATEALVERIIFEKGTEIVASGVQFVSKTGNRLTANATREVILSAGTVKSPQVLELSGIGSSELLKSHGINVVVDNPSVGEHLQDHVMAAVSFEAADGVLTADPVSRDPKVFQSLLAMYEKNRSGPLGEFFSVTAYLPLIETLGPEGKDFMSSLLNLVSPKDLTFLEKRAETINLDQLSQPDSSTTQFGMTKVQFNIKGNSTMSQVLKSRYPENYFTFLVSLHHPFSRGNIHIASASPTDQPTIDPKYLSHPMDIEILARHVRFLSTPASTAPLSNFFKANGRRIPAHAFPHDRPVPTMDEAKELVRETSLSNYHPIGTCGMGKKENGGVVDERLLVHGVKNLRVVDASVFPLMPRANIVTSVYAVAERAVDLIKEDWKGK